MDDLDKKVNEGISLKKFNYTISIVTIVVSIVILISTIMTSTSYNKTHKSTLNYIDWEQTAERLQAGSDYLTDQVRSFVVTGKIKHLDNYFKEVYETKRRDMALELLEEHLAGTSAYSYLESANVGSNQLMKIEFYAMALAAKAYGYDSMALPKEVKNVRLDDSDLVASKEELLNKATEMVFDDTYHSYKERITNEVNQSIVLLGEITERELEESFDSLRRLLVIQQILIIIIVIVVAVEIILTLIQVVHPLVKAIPDIQENKNLELKGAYEYRYLAKTYNKMHEASKKHKQMLEYEATHDSLTGTLNRHGFEEVTKDYNYKNSAILGIDVDNFKYVNDGHGHMIGDALLKHLAVLLEKCLKQDDILCRMGGDEFIIIMSNISDDIVNRSIIRDKINLINTELSIAQGNLPISSISAGVVFGNENMTTEEMLKNADQALYKAKSNGKKTCVFFDEI